MLPQEQTRTRPARPLISRSRRWHVWFWPVAITLILAATGVAAAFLTRPFVGNVKLFAHERTFANQSEAIEFAVSTTSTSAFARVKSKLPPDLTKENFPQRCRVNADSGQPFLGVAATASTPTGAEKLANVFASHVATFAEEWVSKRTREVDKQISAAQKRLEDLRKQFGDFDQALVLGDVRSLRQTLTQDAREKADAVAALQSQLNSIYTEERKALAVLAADQPALKALQQELEQALTRYTDEHPRVKELRASILALQKEAAKNTSKGSTTRTNALLAEINSRRNSVRDKLKRAEASELKSRQTLERFATNEVTFVRLQSEYNALGNRRDDLIQSRVLVGSKGVEKWRRAEQVEITRLNDPARVRNYGFAGGSLGLALGSIVLLARRGRQRVIRSEASLQDATGLPVIAALPHLGLMSASEREYWAVETLQRLRNATGTPRRGSFVCGIISATAGEGRSTWIDLLADAALRHGNRVLVLGQPDAFEAELLAQSSSTALFAPRPGTESTETKSVAKYLFATDVANLSFQKNWEKALAAWQDEENSVVLIELPPANTSAALLLSSAVPNVLWLSAANTAGTRGTEEHVRGLQSTGCHLVGAALNMSASSSARSRAALATFALAFASVQFAGAQQANRTPDLASTNGLGGVKQVVLAPWQQKLTLGPGDTFDISLYGQADSVRPGTTIGPDGRFSFLQAHDVQADGLTVDELRGRLETILMQYHLAPRVVIVPTAFQSKKYYVLGNVNGRGSFALDKPTTIVEAIARSRGFSSSHGQDGAGARQGSLIQADLTQAFLVRRQTNGTFTREPVDFEALFYRGDLTQNKFLAPDDYMYFPPLGNEDVFVLGEVARHGPLAYTPNLTALGAIAGLGGFTEGAYRQRILVVRGSLQNPETFVVDVGATLRATGSDFKLKPRDIVYVSRKPWARAEELLKAAASDFVRAMVVTYTGREIEPILGDRDGDTTR